MPRARSASPRLASRLMAPRILNTPMSCTFSSLTQVRVPTRASSSGWLSSGVGARCGAITSRARRTSSKVTGEGGVPTSEPQSVSSRKSGIAGVMAGSPLVRRASVLEPVHVTAPPGPDLLARMLEPPAQHPFVFLAPGVVLRDPLARERAVLDLLEDLLHARADVVVHDARAAGHVAVGGGLADELVHLAQPAFVEQVHDQLELVHALVVRDLGLVTGFHQRLETGDDELRGAAAEHRLLAEEIRFGLLRERGLDHAGACAADAVRVG